jgi:mono/diheme cytochrome c family protein
MTRHAEPRQRTSRRRVAPAALLLLLPVAAPGAVQAQVQVASNDAVTAPAAAREITFTKDIAPILQANCQRCHHDGGVAPMALETYQQVRRYAARIKERTGRRDRMGAMPPYYIERGIGIQHYKDDQRLSEDQIQEIASWVDNGTPEGNPADMPAAKTWPKAAVWQLGEPDVVVRSQDFSMKAGAPDWWGNMDPIEIPIPDDRYVRAVQVREINDISGEGGGVGGLFIVHHTIWGTQAPDGSFNQSWPVHELGRNVDIFDDDAAELLKAGSKIVSGSVHLNAAGTDATGHLEFGFYL